MLVGVLSAWQDLEKLGADSEQPLHLHQIDPGLRSGNGAAPTATAVPMPARPGPPLPLPVAA
jgi:hypothetical protein